MKTKIQKESKISDLRAGDIVKTRPRYDSE